MRSLLPSTSALSAVLSGPEGILSSQRNGLILIEASTLPLETKYAAREAGGTAVTVVGSASLEDSTCFYQGVT